MATLAVGSFVAQLITILVSPLTTRLFTPADLGIYTLVTSATSMFGMALSLRYDLSIVYESDESNVLPLVALASLINCFLSFIVAIGYFFYFKFFSTTGYSPLLASLFTFFQCLLFGFVNMLTSYNNRCKEYKTISKANVERTFAQNVGIVGTGFVGWGATGLIAAQTIGYAVGFGKQSRDLLSRKQELKGVSSEDIKRVAVRHRAQALWSTPAALANGFSYSSINYIIECLYSATAVGFYSLSFRMLGLPITIIGSNISRVYAERAASEKKVTGSFTKTFKKVTTSMVVASVPVAIVLIMFSPQLFAIVFGEEWRIAGTYVQILTPMFILRFISASVSPSTMLSDHQSWDLFVQLVLIIAVLASTAITFTLSFPIEAFLTLVNLLCCVIYAVNIYLYWRCSKCK